MPSTRRIRRRRRRPTTRVRRPRVRRSRRALTIRRAPLVQPRSQIVRLKFADYYGVNSAGLAFAVKTFKGNTIYDPQDAVGGGSPTGAAAWSAMYSHYKVLASRCVIRCHTTTPNIPVMFAIQSRVGKGVVTGSRESQQEILEGKDQKSVVLDLYTTSSGGGRISGRVSSAATTYRIMQKEHALDKDLAADTGADPTIKWYWDVIAASADGATTGITGGFLIWITYTVKFYDPKIGMTD